MGVPATQSHLLWAGEAEGGPGAWLSATHLGDVGEIPDSWLQPAPASTIVGIWGVSQQTENSLCVPLTFKLKKNKKDDY